MSLSAGMPSINSTMASVYVSYDVSCEVGRELIVRGGRKSSERDEIIMRLLSGGI